MQLPGTEVVGAELIGRPAEVASELGHLQDVAGDGFGGVVAALHIFDKSLTQRGHGGRSPGLVDIAA